MSSNLSRLIPVLRELEKIAPNQINHTLLLEVIDQIYAEVDNILPPKRSGYIYQAMLYVMLYSQMSTVSPRNATNDLNALWKGHRKTFQRSRKNVFRNNKTRRAIPDQSAMSRFEKMLGDLGLSEKIANCMLFAQFLYYAHDHPITEDATLIADYVEEPCPKDKEDPYCFGSKLGKTHHKTLTFSIIWGRMHLIIATYKVKKGQPIPPLFEDILARLNNHLILIKYGLFDRGFYRKQLLLILKNWKITVIMPARNCTDTKRKIFLWIQDQSGRTGKLYLKIGYIKKVGYQRLMMGVVLAGKRGHDLQTIKTDFKQGKISLIQASKQVFPLLVIRGNAKGIQCLKGNENYIRSLYRERWAIEIAFRSIHLLGISNWVQQRDTRLLRFSCKCMIYNLWQIEREKILQNNPIAEPLSLDEFCGSLHENRTIQVLPVKC